MNDYLSSQVPGFILGGLGTYVLTHISERWWKFYDSRLKYSQFLWIDCYELSKRLSRVSLGNPDTLGALRLSLADSPKTIEWFTKDGYYVASTVYLISRVSAWITLIESDQGFLRFSRRRQTTEFFVASQKLKRAISNSDQGSILWWVYLTGIGEGLIESSKPINFFNFLKKLESDEQFRSFYEQAFHFTNSLSDLEKSNLLDQVVDSLSQLMTLLQSFGVIPVDVDEDTLQE